MMPPFVVLPTNRIAHFVEVSLYSGAAQSSRQSTEKNMTEMFWQNPGNFSVTRRAQATWTVESTKETLSLSTSLWKEKKSPEHMPENTINFRS